MADSAAAGTPGESRISRGRFVTALGGGALGLALGSGSGFALARSPGESAAETTIPFFGEHQAGILTPQQDRVVFASFDLTTTSRAELRDLLRAWTDAGARMTAGDPVGTVAGHPQAPPDDTGEALGLHASRLTLTFGFGPSLFDHRFGLSKRRPSVLTPLGPLPGEELDPTRSDGDLCVQACADDPQVAFHAVRNLARIGRGAAVLRWTQLGFGRTASNSNAKETPRNLQGFKDGTNNLAVDNAVDLQRFVWAGKDEPQHWFRGGTYLVTRRVRMLIETWDRLTLDHQENTIGRRKISGAPLSGQKEHDAVELDARNPNGSHVIPLTAHVRQASPKANNGQKILRRGYSYTDGIDPVTGQLDAGLFFIAFQRDPHKQFAAIQRRLGTQDELTEYIKHTASGLFGVPPGARQGGFVGEGLFT
jgi:deferrochelatase/peroxidase EfeB